MWRWKVGVLLRGSGRDVESGKSTVKEVGSKVQGRRLAYPLGKSQQVFNHREMDLHTSVRLWNCFLRKKN